MFGVLGLEFEIKDMAPYQHFKMQTILENDADVAEAYFELGNTFLGRQNCDQAIACYQKALQHKPDFIEAYYNLGVVLHEQKKLAQAIFCYQKALALKSDFVEEATNSDLYAILLFSSTSSIESNGSTLTDIL